MATRITPASPPGLVKIAVRNREGLREIEKAEKHQGSLAVLGGVL
jgi:hypothetical protein